MEKIAPLSNKKPYFWSARDLMEVLDYKTWPSFQNIIEQSVKTMITADIPYFENIIQTKRTNGKSKELDFKLSRFACFIIVMLADYKKDAVKDAQARFLQKANAIGWTKKELYQLERFKIREEIADANKWLNSVVARRSLQDFSAFNESGYHGLYGMSSNELHKLKDVGENKSLQDSMGSLELTIHLMRIVLTEETIWRKKITKQNPLEKIHFNISKDLRKLVKTHLAINMEALPIYEDLPHLKSKLKQNYKKMNKK